MFQKVTYHSHDAQDRAHDAQDHAHDAQDRAHDDMLSYHQAHDYMLSCKR